MKLKRPQPDFLYIGAQRSGSTWLYNMFKEHPQVWMVFKEVHFFDKLRKEEYLCQVFKRHVRQRLRMYRERRRPITAASLLWDLNFLRWPRTDKWYASLFPADPGLVSGDITPAYGILELDEIGHVFSLNPGMKLIMIMRDPIDRAWSHARKQLPINYGKAIDHIPESTVIEWFGSFHCFARSDYASILQKWGSWFPDGQIFKGFFEEIRSSPLELLQRISVHLGIESPTSASEALSKPVNAARDSSPLLPAYERALARLHYPGLERLSHMLPGAPVDAWLARAKAALT